MHADVTKGAQGLKVLNQTSLAFRVQSPPLHKPVPQTILLPSTPSQGPPLYYGTSPGATLSIARLQNPPGNAEAW